MYRNFDRFVSETQSRLPPVPESTNVGGLRAADVPPRVEKEQEQQGSSDPGNTTQRLTPLIYLVVTNRATSGGCTIQAAEAENGQPEMKTTMTPVSAE